MPKSLNVSDDDDLEELVDTDDDHNNAIVPQLLEGALVAASSSLPNVSFSFSNLLVLVPVILSAIIARSSDTIFIYNRQQKQERNQRNNTGCSFSEDEIPKRLFEKTRIV
ncbi:hypothetical protein TNCV_4096621 [Trichonephila clavipes]|nr:hypothetical protein TNCV_4096621 [Trichonephila clavipes]